MTKAAITALAIAGLLVASADSASDRNLRIAQAFVSKHCHSGSRTATDVWQAGWTFNALYGDCGGGDGHDQRVWFFAGSRFIGNDASGSSAQIIASWRDDKTIAFLYVLYRQTDALCCPTGGAKTVRFRWTGTRLIRIDALPRRTAAASPGRYP